MLTVSNLQCIRGERELFSGLSFELKSHQLMRIEGENGSGKTTLLRTLCGLFVPDNGEILWNDVPTKKQQDEYHRNLFYLGHQNAIKTDLTVIENLRFNCKQAGQNPTEDEMLNALDRIGLYAYEDFPVGHLSQGQKRRVALARLLIIDAPLWILDEPFVALDAEAVRQLQSTIAQHVEKGGMVILTTHQEVPLTSGEILSVNLDVFPERDEKVET